MTEMVLPEKRIWFCFMSASQLSIAILCMLFGSLGLCFRHFVLRHSINSSVRTTKLTPVNRF